MKKACHGTGTAVIVVAALVAGAVLVGVQAGAQTCPQIENPCPANNNTAGAEADYATISGGKDNQVSNGYATVSGGHGNHATGYSSTVSGGESNDASEYYSTVSGGESNDASDYYSTVSGGYYNQATGGYATVSGGYNNDASGDYSTMSGGYLNAASERYSTVSGGCLNGATGKFSAVSGGRDNQAVAPYSAVSGGISNTAEGGSSFVGGGKSNSATGSRSVVPGGWGNSANGDQSFAAGRCAVAAGHGCFAWADSTGAELLVSAPNRFAARASGGVYFYTSSNSSSGSYLAAGSGTWASVSSRKAKENFTPVDTQEVLDKVMEIPISTWNYKTEDCSVRHMGPMAEDLHAAFALGDSDRTVTTIDADGLSLAAIQGLYRLLEQKDQEIAELQDQMAALREMVTASK